MFDLDEALKKQEEYPAQDRGDESVESTEEMEHFDLEAALSPPSDLNVDQDGDPVADANGLLSSGFDEQLINPSHPSDDDANDPELIAPLIDVVDPAIPDLELEAAIAVPQGTLEPPELRTVRIGDSDVIYFNAGNPESVDDASGLSSSDLDDEIIDPSHPGSVWFGDDDFLEDDDSEPELKAPLIAVVSSSPSMFSASFSTTELKRAFRSDSSEDISIAVKPSKTPSMFSSNSTLLQTERSFIPSDGVEARDSKANETAITSTGDISFAQPDGSGTFLPVPATATDVLTPAQAVVKQAGCSEATVQAASNLTISQLPDLLKDVEPQDAKKISNQLDRNAFVEWSPNSIYDGLGQDASGNSTGISLIQLSNSLSNMNEHLLIIEMELLKFEAAIKQVQTANKLKELGFEDPANITHISTVLNCLDEANKNMVDRIASLLHTLQIGRASKNRKHMNIFGVGCAIGAALASLVLLKRCY